MHRIERSILVIVRRKCFHLVYYNSGPSGRHWVGWSCKELSTNQLSPLSGPIYIQVSSGWPLADVKMSPDTRRMIIKIKRAASFCLIKTHPALLGAAAISQILLRLWLILNWPLYSANTISCERDFLWPQLCPGCPLTRCDSSDRYQEPCVMQTPARASGKLVQG